MSQDKRDELRITNDFACCVRVCVCVRQLTAEEGKMPDPKSASPYCHSNGRSAVCSISIIYFVSHSHCLLVFYLVSQSLSLSPSSCLSVFFLLFFLTPILLLHFIAFYRYVFFYPSVLPPSVSEPVLMLMLSVYGKAADTHTGIVGHTHTHYNVLQGCCYCYFTHPGFY